MPGSKQRDPLADNATAFEYVTGTLRGAERQAVDKLRVTCPELETHIHFWEDHLMGLQNYQLQRSPSKDVWEKIVQRINTPNRQQENRTSISFPWHWLSASALTLVLLIAVFLPKPTQEPRAFLADYVAVLLAPEGEPLLTVLAAGEDKVMQLNWALSELPTDSSVQLWAVSRRDGMIRSLRVFEHLGEATISLSAADWRLIQDAEALLLTEEEPGGSALDRPSDAALARGVCVRLRDV